MASLLSEVLLDGITILHVVEPKEWQRIEYTNSSLKKSGKQYVLEDLHLDIRVVGGEELLGTLAVGAESLAEDDDLVLGDRSLAMRHAKCE